MNAHKIGARLMNEADQLETVQRSLNELSVEIHFEHHVEGRPLEEALDSIIQLVRVAQTLTTSLQTTMRKIQ